MRFYNNISVDLFKLFHFSFNIKVQMDVDLCSYRILSCSISHLCTTSRHNNGKKKKLFCRYSLRYCRVVTSQKLQKMLMTHLAPGAIQKCLAYLHFFAIEHLWTGGVRCLGERRRPVSVPRCFMELLDGSISLVCDL